MMEEFLRKHSGDEVADYYKNSDDKVKTQIELGIFSIFAKVEKNNPINIEKEIVTKNGKNKVRYIIETDLK
ncbi:hypothetical protein IGI37_000120 [Enterococcus sp. AZ194]|uniref:hypothetical protein n=1 Tax=Enterococcus sp. AZ194 TaxID=2774629 RepID=UPI003F244220